MPSYETRKVEVRVGDQLFRLKALLDHQQFSDPEGHAERAGISSATWPLFGQLWPASWALAQAVHGVDIAGRRILEIGCGLGLPSLVLQQRGADITASDHHPLVERFLDYNATLNQLEPLNYYDLPWDEAAPELGRFDLIIGSDVLYERDHAELVAQVIERRANPEAEVLITCPGRGYRAVSVGHWRRKASGLPKSRVRFRKVKHRLIGGGYCASGVRASSMPFPASSADPVHPY